MPARSGRFHIRRRMLTHRPDLVARLSHDQQPLLVVIIDTEEEFDWTKPFARENTGVAHILAQARAQAVYARFGVKPLYAIDYPVASQPHGYGPLREWTQAGACEIGTHLHPWVSPPFDEPVNNRNSYPGNLPVSLERTKLTILTDAIAQRFGERPTVYRAGRYGYGPNTAAILSELGYQIDTSVVPRTDFGPDEGPDFSEFGIDPYWIDREGGLLEVPLTVGWTGLLAGAGPWLQPICRKPRIQKLRLPGMLARTGLFERIRLTPEGMTFDELRRLTIALLARGQRIFNFTYHSPSLEVGHTPYVRSAKDLRAFVDTIDRYLEFFLGEIGGRATTFHDIRDLCLAAGRAARRPPASVAPAASAR
jgi:peptidoglycan/xylan/chitin deacetylase (PgdA/CDA1 family)